VKYKVVIYWSPEDEAYIAEVPELAGCIADGATYLEAISNVQIIMERWIQTATELGRPIPQPQEKLIAVDFMNDRLDYAKILKKVVNDATIHQPSLQPIKLYPVCDLESGQFVVLATGFDKQRWMDFVLFHARLIEKDNSDRQVIIEEDNFEEGLVDTLIAAGIKKEDIVTSWQQAIKHKTNY
jgi:predicted RNase H-like HicB family nuclease